MKKPPTTTRRNGTVRCAIYTRKSSEEGLEQEFNSLQAQREACEAFINSQRHEGWVCLRAAYDDGGFSGATMDRPALQQLLADLTAGRVDTIVVYKIDRLTRSLADFAKIVEIFADPSIQHRRVAWATEIGKHWPELPVARKRAVLTTLIERIDVRVDRIDLRLCPPRLAALLDGPDTSPQGANDEETELLSIPVQLRRAGREIRMVMDGTDPFATAKPNARLVKLLLRARRFNAALTQ